jgi:predicted nucleotidyltransferase
MAETLIIRPAETSITPDVIMSAVDGIEARHNVRVLIAVESGSRAWGFPSPDSDWDVRFIYARPVKWYLQIRERRDVIEEVDGLLDVSGWDVRKALGLLLKSNASALEWLRSPIVYRERPEAALLRDFAEQAAIGGVQRHYFYLARSIWKERFASGQIVKIKKYFYLIRPALALRFIRLTGAVPPMDLPALLAGVQLEPGVSALRADLVARKAVSREFDEAARIPEIDALCLAEMSAAESGLVDVPPTTDAQYAAADDVFRAVVGYAEGSNA